MIEKNR